MGPAPGCRTTTANIVGCTDEQTIPRPATNPCAPGHPRTLPTTNHSIKQHSTLRSIATRLLTDDFRPFPTESQKQGPTPPQPHCVSWQAPLADPPPLNRTLSPSNHPPQSTFLHTPLCTHSPPPLGPPTPLTFCTAPHPPWPPLPACVPHCTPPHPPCAPFACVCACEMPCLCERARAL